MSSVPLIKLREYEKKPSDKHEDYTLETKQDQELMKELEQKQILTITRGNISKKLEFEAYSQIGVAQFSADKILARDVGVKLVASGYKGKFTFHNILLIKIKFLI